MMVILRWLITIPIIVVCVFWAVSNRQDIEIIFSPLHDPVTMPVYFLILGALALGFFVGATSCWFSMSGLRKQKREQKKEIKQLKKDLDIALVAHKNAPAVPLASQEKNTHD